MASHCNNFDLHLKAAKASALNARGANLDLHTTTNIGVDAAQVSELQFCKQVCVLARYLTQVRQFKPPKTKGFLLGKALHRFWDMREHKTNQAECPFSLDVHW